MFEESSKDSLKYLDLMMYPASVTSCMPASYPFLDPDPDEYGDSPGMVISAILLHCSWLFVYEILIINHDIFDCTEVLGDEKTRTLTRIAYNPLTAYYGGGTDSRIDAASVGRIKDYLATHNVQIPSG